LTGSSDGLVRAVQLLPTKLLGVVADHGQFPVERIVIDRRGEGRWVGSASHDEVLKLTDLKDVFEDEEEEDAAEESEKEAGSAEDNEEENQDKVESEAEAKESEGEVDDKDESEEEQPEPKKRKRKQDKDPMARKKGKKGRNELVTDPSFFSDL
jgi:hypothetical protein